MGRALFQLERYDEAERAYESALNLDPDNLGYLNALAALQMKTSRFEEAIGGYRRVLQAEPANAMAQLSLGLCLIQTGETEAAVEALQRAHELNPSQVEAPLNLAILHDRAGRYQEAARWYEAALEIREHPVALLNLGLLYGRRFNDNPRAVKTLERAARVAPDNPAIFFNLGVAYRAAGEMDKSRAAFQQAVRLDPRLAERMRPGNPG
jgi:tetratricopeptide (TPR) repeat protein